jgi:formylglycine-generating enzyme required for sulfatase activity
VRVEIASFFADRKRGDLALLYFSGHGVTDDDGRLYLTTTDTRRKLLRATAVPATFVNETMTDSRSRRQVLLLDCCHSGAFAKGGENVGIKERFEGRGRVVLTSSTSTQYAFQGDEIIGEGSCSVFTHHLVRGLETGEADTDRDGLVSLDELYDYVYDRVTDETPNQTPGKWTFDLRGDIVIARSPASSGPQAGLPTWIVEALASSAYSARLAAVGELAQLVQGQDPRLVAVARAELERLGREDADLAVRGAATGALGVVTRIGKVEETKLPPRISEVEQLKALGSDRIIWKRDGKEMVRVPAGEFLYGEIGEERELFEFWIDKTPVTNAEYAGFVAATGHEPPEHWKGKTPPGNIAEHPVVWVSWRDAVAYAQWAGKRLPDEEEWEKAARGTDGRRYPWGSWAEWRCNSRESGNGTTTPVNQYSPDGDSPYGCVDMAGNAWEWTTSSMGGENRVVRGGSFDYDCDYARCTHRGGYALDRHWINCGFRCVVCSDPSVDDSRRVSAALSGAVEPAPVLTPVVPELKPTPASRREAPVEPKPDTLVITSPIHLELVRIPAGEFLMGSDPTRDRDARDDEQPQHSVYIPEFYIGRHPVTNAQYVVFVQATEHRAPVHWKRGRVPSGKENHPVVNVSWRDAMAFCEWLGKETGKSFTLPSEAEWEKAARSTDGRIYPWGNEFDRNKCNAYELGIGDTTSVGWYSPQGDSPYGCADMAGNVWEWTRSLYRDYPYNRIDWREELEAGDLQVQRGGSFNYDGADARCASRNNLHPNNRSRRDGFRCISPVSSF